MLNRSNESNNTKVAGSIIFVGLPLEMTPFSLQSKFYPLLIKNVTVNSEQMYIIHPSQEINFLTNKGGTRDRYYIRYFYFCIN